MPCGSDAILSFFSLHAGQTESKRRYFIIQSCCDIGLEMLSNAVRADRLFYKRYGTGLLIVLKYLDDNKKKHSTVERRVVELETKLLLSSKRAGLGTSSSSASIFMKLGDVGSGKVRSFSGRERLEDPLFREIFDVSRKQEGGSKELFLQDDVATYCCNHETHVIMAPAKVDYNPVRKMRLTDENSCSTQQKEEGSAVILGNAEEDRKRPTPPLCCAVLHAQLIAAEAMNAELAGRIDVLLRDERDKHAVWLRELQQEGACVARYRYRAEVLEKECALARARADRLDRECVDKTAAFRELEATRVRGEEVRALERQYRDGLARCEREMRRMQQVIVGSVGPDRDDEVAALRAEIERLRQEREAGVCGMAAVRERDARIGALETEVAHMAQLLRRANAEVERLGEQVARMEDRLMDTPVAAATRARICREVKGVYYSAGEMRTVRGGGGGSDDHGNDGVNRVMMLFSEDSFQTEVEAELQLGGADRGRKRGRGGRLHSES